MSSTDQIHHHHHKVKSRGLSPFRRISGGSNHSRNGTGSHENFDGHHPNSVHDHRHHHHHHHHSKSPLRVRSLSPFGHHESHKAKKQNVMICHESAHAIVFRDHLRLARKIIQEVNEDDEDFEEDEKETEEVDSGNESSDSEEDKEDEVESAEAAFKGIQSLKQSIRASVRESNRSNNNNDVDNLITSEIQHLAHDLVPELKSVTVDLKHISERNIEIEGLHAHITPLEDLPLNSRTDFDALLHSSPTLPNNDDWSEAEKEVYLALKNEKACVKTIKSNEWPSFLRRFQKAKPTSKSRRAPNQHEDIGPRNDGGGAFPFNSFVTSTSLLPSLGKKMRAYGSELSYPVGVVFALPDFESAEKEQSEVLATETWAWPAGYAAKTEFNIDNRGKLINGRQEALASLQQIRQYNHDYLTAEDHYIAGKVIKGGFNVVPYNEIFLRVGGRGRIVKQQDVVTGAQCVDQDGTGRSLSNGVGLFVALFVRSVSMGDLLQLFRTRARIADILGIQYIKQIPLLYIHQDVGVRVFSNKLQREFWSTLSLQVQPFANPAWANTVKYHDTNEASFEHKMQELLPLDDGDVDAGAPANNQNSSKKSLSSSKSSGAESMLEGLTHHELAKIAGGFGATDISILKLLRQQPDFQHVHDILQEGFAAAIRAGDYFVARQLLLLYSLANTYQGSRDSIPALLREKLRGQPAATYMNLSILEQHESEITNLPTPLATKRLRRATTSDGLLVVLGAAQILKTVTTTSARRRTEESYVAVEEWVHHGEESVAFRVASWREQRADQADSNIAMSNDSKFMAFVTNKSVHNRRRFAQQLRKAAPEHHFTTVGFLHGIYDIVQHLHSPCMRLELLQYILGLDNRYSKDLIKESIELAATCLSLVS